MAPPQLAPQATGYTTSGIHNMPPHPDPSSRAPPYYPPPMSSALPSGPPQAPAPTQPPVDPLEQRILDLIFPFREDCIDPNAENAVEEERKVLILCENIAFLIRHNQSSFGRVIGPNDVSIASRNWRAMKAATGPAGVGVFVNGINSTHNICRVIVHPGQSVVDCMTNQVDEFVQPFFPEI